MRIVTRLAAPVRLASIVAAVLLMLSLPAMAADAKPKPYRLPSTSLKERVIWGATCEGSDGTGLAFGGQDQAGPDGRGGTRLLENGEWKPIGDDLRARNKLATFHQRCLALRESQASLLAQVRALYFKGLPEAQRRAALHDELLPVHRQIGKELIALTVDLRGQPDLAASDAARVGRAVARLDASLQHLDGIAGWLGQDVTADALHALWDIQTQIEQAAEPLDAEPPARALSPIVYDSKTGLYVLFGGDHCDYLTNDIWTFDPKLRQWSLRNPKTAPPPRANHKLTADGNGLVRLSGGYTYADNTDYMGGQYIDRADGDWVYDIAADRWTSASAEPLAAADVRLYHAGPFHPDFFFRGDPPDAAAFQKRLADLPVNTWVSIKPPHLPQMNRDWGSAVLDVDRDQVLRFSGGHCAHGGSDVLHFHLATGRWELPFPVEFPLGQCYTNTEYPDGFNFNHRPWVTGHTYQCYGYDPVLKAMLFTGHPKHYYTYDPDRADWTSRAAKPKGMDYGDSFYDLTLCPTPAGLVCWNKEGQVFRFDAGKKEWARLETHGVKLPGAVVDNSTIVYDSKRHRALMVRKQYGDKYTFDGRLYALDLKTLETSLLDPPNAAAAAAVPYLCQLRYDPASDLLLAGCTLPPDAGADLRRTPAYDCAANRWVSLSLTGDDPSGPKGRNVSLGMVHDPKRNLFWAVDTKSNVFVLKLDVAKAGKTEMKAAEP